MRRSSPLDSQPQQNETLTSTTRRVYTMQVQLCTFLFVTLTLSLLPHPPLLPSLPFTALYFILFTFFPLCPSTSSSPLSLSFVSPLFLPHLSLLSPPSLNSPCSLSFLLLFLPPFSLPSFSLISLFLSPHFSSLLFNWKIQNAHCISHTTSFSLVEPFFWTPVSFS